MADYNIDVRPVLNQATKTNVTLDFTLLQLINMVRIHFFISDKYRKIYLQNSYYKYLLLILKFRL